MKSKQTDHISEIILKRRCVFTENFTIFFSNAGKTLTYRNSNLINSRRPSFGDNINVRFISFQPPRGLKNFIYLTNFIQ